MGGMAASIILGEAGIERQGGTMPERATHHLAHRCVAPGEHPSRMLRFIGHQAVTLLDSIGFELPAERPGTRASQMARQAPAASAGHRPERSSSEEQGEGVRFADSSTVARRRGDTSGLLHHPGLGNKPPSRVARQTRPETQYIRSRAAQFLGIQADGQPTAAQPRATRARAAPKLGGEQGRRRRFLQPVDRAAPGWPSAAST